jgi:hypothetical protein
MLDDMSVEGSAPTLSGAVERGRARAATLGRIIVEVWADGQKMDGDALEAAMQDGLSPVEVRLVSEAPTVVVRSALIDAAEALTGAQEAQARAAENILAGSPEKATEPLLEALRVWESVKRVVEEGSALLGRRLESDGAMLGLIDGLRSRLESIGDLLEREDWAALADELEDEMEAEATRWRRGLSALSQSLA